MIIPTLALSLALTLALIPTPSLTLALTLTLPLPLTLPLTLAAGEEHDQSNQALLIAFLTVRQDTHGQLAALRVDVAAERKAAAVESEAWLAEEEARRQAAQRLEAEQERHVAQLHGQLAALHAEVAAEREAASAEREMDVHLLAVQQLQAEHQAEEQQERCVAYLQRTAERRMRGRELADAWMMWHGLWTGAARQRRLAAAAGGLSRRHALAAAFAAWRTVWCRAVREKLEAAQLLQEHLLPLPLPYPYPSPTPTPTPNPNPNPNPNHPQGGADARTHDAPHIAPARGGARRAMCIQYLTYRRLTSPLPEAVRQ